MCFYDVADTYTIVCFYDVADTYTSVCFFDVADTYTIVCFFDVADTYTSHVAHVNASFRRAHTNSIHTYHTSLPHPPQLRRRGRCDRWGLMQAKAKCISDDVTSIEISRVTHMYSSLHPSYTTLHPHLPHPLSLRRRGRCG